MESYIGHGGQFLFPFLFGKDLQVIFSTEFFYYMYLLNKFVSWTMVIEYWYVSTTQMSIHLWQFSAQL